MIDIKKILECFGTPYIGIIGDCDTTQPSSGIFLNDLPGIDYKTATEIAPEEYVRGDRMIRALEKEAIEYVIRDIEANMKCFSFNDVIETQLTGVLGDAYSEPINKAVGRRIKRTSTNPYQRIKLDCIWVKVDRDARKSITISDGCKEIEKCIDLKECRENKVFINEIFQGDEITVMINGCDIGLSKHDWSSTCGCDDSCGCPCECNPCFEIYTEDCFGNRMTGTNGIRLQVSCITDQTAFWCQMGNLIKYMVRMIIARDLIKTAQFSDKCTSLIRNVQNNAEVILGQWFSATNIETGMKQTPLYYQERSKTIKQIEKRLQQFNPVAECDGGWTVQTFHP